MVPIMMLEAFVGRRHPVERALVCAMQGQFPVLARGPADELGVALRVGAGHYGLGGTLATVGSVDGGRTWSDPIEVAPRGDDLRNPAFTILADGSWLLAYWRAGARCYPAGADGARRWRLPGALAADEADAFVIRSADRGRRWSAPRPVRASGLAWLSPFGRIAEASDRALVMAAYGPRRDDADGRFAAIALRSVDGGATWGDEVVVADDGSELSLWSDGAGRWLGAVRRAAGDTALVRSDDDGRTWSAPRAVTGPREHPADLCRLRGGRLLLTFGRRHRPLGCGALTSGDDGASWDRDREVLLAGDGIGNDVGYPSTVQLADGTIVTALYFARGSQPSEPSDGWGETSCQVVRYPEAVVAPATGAG